MTSVPAPHASGQHWLESGTIGTVPKCYGCLQSLSRNSTGVIVQHYSHHSHHSSSPWIFIDFQYRPSQRVGQKDAKDSGSRTTSTHDGLRAFLSAPGALAVHLKGMASWLAHDDMEQEIPKDFLLETNHLI